MKDASWKPLRLSHPSDSVPELLIKSAFSSDGYEILLTDMRGQLWSQTANRKDVVKQSLNDDTAIDASDGDSNRRSLLEKIEGALNSAAGSSCQFVPKSNRSLSLAVAVPLPKPLKDLEWEFKLELSPTRFFSEFVHPLITSSYSQQRRTKDLITQLNHKDHVIDTLVNRLKAAGTELSAVFPAVKSDNRTQAGKHIRGLGQFDRAQWLKSMEKNSVEEVSTGDMIKSISSSLRGSSGHEGDNEARDDWWRDQAALPSRAAGTNKPPAANGPKAMSNISQNDDEDDEFQRQPTPPDLRKPVKEQKYNLPSGPAISVHSPRHARDVRQAVESDDETTDDEDDLDAPSSSRVSKPCSVTPEPTSVAVSVKPKPKLGTIGGKKPPLPKATPEPADEPKDAGRHDSDTTDDDDALKQPSTRPSASPKKTPALLSPKRGKLGMIGGKKKDSEGASDSLRTAPANETGVRAPSMASSSAGHESSSDRESTRDAQVKPEAISQNPAEMDSEQPKSTQDRANEKRAELKRVLEEAKNKPPTKKKRRF